MEATRKKEIKEYIVPGIASFILSILLTVMGYLIGTYFGLFNKALVIDAMNKSTYYESVNKYCYTEALDYLYPSNLDESVLENVFTIKNTYNQGKNYLLAVLNGDSYNINTDYVKDTLTSNIEAYIQSNNIPEENIDREGINNLIDHICLIYSKNLSVSFLYYYNSLKAIFRQLIVYGLPALALLSIACLLVILRSNKWLHRSLRFVSYSLLAATIMTSILPLGLLISKKYQQLNVRPVYFSKMLARYLRASLNIYLVVSLILFIGALLIICVIYYKKKSLMKSM